MPSFTPVVLGRLLRSEPARFVMVGVLNTLFGYGVYAVLVLVTHRPPLALVLSYVIGATFNYFTTGRLVFANTGLSAFAPFVGGYLIVLAANLGAQAGLARLGVAPLINQAILLPFMVALSYVTNRYLVFRKARVRPVAGGSAPGGMTR